MTAKAKEKLVELKNSVQLEPGKEALTGKVSLPAKTADELIEAGLVVEAEKAE